MAFAVRCSAFLFPSFQGTVLLGVCSLSSSSSPFVTPYVPLDNWLLLILMHLKCIFTLGTKNLGVHTKRGSGLIVMVSPFLYRTFPAQGFSLNPGCRGRGLVPVCTRCPRRQDIYPSFVSRPGVRLHSHDHLRYVRCDHLPMPRRPHI